MQNVIRPEDYNIPVLGGRVKVPHKDCPMSTSAAMTIQHKPEGIWFYCHACKAKEFIRHDQSYSQYRAKQEEARQHERQKMAKQDWSLPADCSHNLPPETLAWLAGMHFGPALIDKWQVQYSPSLNRVILPLAIGWQGKHLLYKEDKQPKYLLHSPDRYWLLGRTAPEDLLVIVEDAYSAIRLSKFFRVLCLLGTPVKMPVIFKDNPEVLLWLDPDAAGRRTQRLLKHELKYSCRVVDLYRLPGNYDYYKHKDPKYYSDEELRELKGMLWKM